MDEFQASALIFNANESSRWPTMLFLAPNVLRDNMFFTATKPSQTWSTTAGLEPLQCQSPSSPGSGILRQSMISTDLRGKPRPSCALKNHFWAIDGDLEPQFLEHLERMLQHRRCTFTYSYAAILTINIYKGKYALNKHWGEYKHWPPQLRSRAARRWCISAEPCEQPFNRNSKHIHYASVPKWCHIPQMAHVCQTCLNFVNTYKEGKWL